MSSTIPPTYYFNGIQYNSDFFKSPSAPLTLDYANENYLGRIGNPNSIASSTNFTGDMIVSGQMDFNNIASPPHCDAVPVSDNDLVNKLYVDTVSPRVSYIVYCNYSQTFITTTPTTYKKLSVTEVITPQTVTFNSIKDTPILIAGFFNTLTDLKFSNPLPAGNITLLTFANVDNISDQQKCGINFQLVGVSAVGVETIIATSVSSSLISVIAPLIGSYSSTLTIPTTTITGFTQIGIKMFLTGIQNNHTGSIFFQYNDYYTELITTYGIIAAPDLLNLNNTWTGINTFNNTIDINSNTTISGSLTLDNSISANRQINNVFYNLVNSSALATTNGRIYANGTSIFYENFINNGFHSFVVLDNLGVQRNPLAMTSNDISLATAGQNGLTIDVNQNVSIPNGTLSVVDTVNVNITSAGTPKIGLNVKDNTLNNNIQLIPSITGGHLSPFGSAGSSAIVSLNGTVGNQPLELYPWSNNTVGIRLTGTSALIGAGGTTSLNPTSSITFAGTSATMAGSLSIPNGTLDVDGISTFTGRIDCKDNIIMNGLTSGTTTLASNFLTGNLRIQGPQVASTYGISMSVNAGTSGDVLTIIPTGVTSAAVTIWQPLTVNSSINGITTISNKNLGSGTVIIGSATYTSLTGTSNTIVGGSSGSALTNGTSNTFLGQNTGSLASSASNNCLIGAGAGANLTTGLRNTILGKDAGNLVTISNDNTCIGFNAQVPAAFGGSSAIGANSLCSASNQIQLGIATNNVNCPGTLSVVGTTTINGGIVLGGVANIGSSSLIENLSIYTPLSSNGGINFLPKNAISFSITSSGNTSQKSLTCESGLSVTSGNSSFTNTVTAPTPLALDNSTKVATTEYVNQFQRNYNNMVNPVANLWNYKWASVETNSATLAPVTGPALTVTTSMFQNVFWTAGLVITNLGFWTGGGTGNFNGTQMGIYEYKASPSLLAKTVAFGGAQPQGVAITLALMTPYTVPTTGMYVVCILRGTGTGGSGALTMAGITSPSSNTGLAVTNDSTVGMNTWTSPNLLFENPYIGVNSFVNVRPFIFVT